MNCIKMHYFCGHSFLPEIERQLSVDKARITYIIVYYSMCVIYKVLAVDFSYSLLSLSLSDFRWLSILLFVFSSTQLAHIPKEKTSRTWTFKMLILWHYIKLENRNSACIMLAHPPTENIKDFPLNIQKHRL